MHKVLHRWSKMDMNNQRKIGVVLQYAQMGISIVISFIYTPIMLGILGKSEYGIYNLAYSIISYLSLLSLGFGASYIRFYSRYKKDSDNEGIAKLNGIFLLTFIIIGIVAFISGLFLANNVELFFNSTYTLQDKKIAHILMIFMAINLAISFPCSVFTSYISSQEKFIFQKILSMVKTVVGPFLTLPALLAGWGSVGMVIVTTIITVFVEISSIYFCLTKLEMRFDFKEINFSLLKEIASFSIFIAINQLIDQINWATDKVILGKMCSSTAVAYYAIGAQLNTYFTQFSTAISNVFVPHIHRIENSDQEKRDINRAHTALMIKVGRIQFMLMALILTGFIFFGKFFISIWAGKEYGSAYYVALLLMVPAMVPLIQNVGIEIQRAKNKHQFRSIVYLVMAILNIVISICFTKWWGEIGAALGTTISLILANGLAMNLFYHKIIGINIIEFWEEILKFIPALVVPIFGGIILNKFYSFRGLWDFGLFVILYVVVYSVSMFLLGMNNSEKALIRKMLKKVLKNDKDCR